MKGNIKREREGWRLASGDRSSRKEERGREGVERKRMGRDRDRQRSREKGTDRQTKR